jgi:hypothetical protein
VTALHFNDIALSVTGTLASQLGLLANLTELYVGPRSGRSSRIHGSLPSELFALTKLSQFFVMRCAVSGPVTGLSRLTNLKALGLSENSLNGSVNVSRLTRLENLFINDNPNLAASLADMSTMSAMTSLYVHNSSTTGSLDDITGLTQLVELGVSRSKITGSLPWALGRLSLLAYVYADRLGLTGTLPSELFRLPLEDLYLGGNALTGTVPTWISSLSKLKQLGLSGNSFVSAPNLANLSLDECYFWDSCFPCASLNNANCTKECSSRDCSITTTTAAATTTTTTTTTTTASSSMSTMLMTMLTTWTPTSPSALSTTSSSSSSLTGANDFVTPASDFDVATVAGAAGGGVVALVLIGVVLFCWCRARKSKNPETTPDVSPPSDYSRISLPPRMDGSGSSDSVSLASAPTSAYSAWDGSSFGAPAEYTEIRLPNVDASNGYTTLPTTSS